MKEEQTCVICGSTYHGPKQRKYCYECSEIATALRKQGKASTKTPGLRRDMYAKVLALRNPRSRSQEENKLERLEQRIKDKYERKATPEPALEPALDETVSEEEAWLRSLSERELAEALRILSRKLDEMRRELDRRHWDEQTRQNDSERSMSADDFFTIKHSAKRQAAYHKMKGVVDERVDEAGGLDDSNFERKNVKRKQDGTIDKRSMRGPTPVRCVSRSGKYKNHRWKRTYGPGGRRLSTCMRCGVHEDEA